MRRDQIGFTEKAADGASDLYSLVEYRINQSTAVRNDASFSNDYLAGKYGAIPYFGNVAQFSKDFYLHGLCQSVQKTQPIRASGKCSE